MYPIWNYFYLAQILCDRIRKVSLIKSNNGLIWFKLMQFPSLTKMMFSWYDVFFKYIFSILNNHEKSIFCIAIIIGKLITTLWIFIFINSCYSYNYFKIKSWDFILYFFDLETKNILIPVCYKFIFVLLCSC